LGRSPNTRKTKKNPLDQKLDGFLKILRSAMGIATATFKFGNLVSFLFAEMDGWQFLVVGRQALLLLHQIRRIFFATAHFTIKIDDLTTIVNGRLCFLLPIIDD
jgi:hypothetical protein